METSLRPSPLALTREQVVRLAFPLAIGATVVLALALRMWRPLMAELPLNDGGMFYAAIEDIRSSGGALPRTLSYNGEAIPFAYPPLAFYLALAVSATFAVATEDVLRLLPPVVSALTVIAFVPLALRLSPSRTAAAIAVFVMAVQPSAYAWMIMGGGLTRGLGILFATLGLVAFDAFLRDGTRRTALATGAIAALTALTHIEMAWVLAFSCVVFLVLRAPRPRERLGGALGAAAFAAVVTAPWWLLVAARHGVEPFIAAATTGSLSDPLLDLLAFSRTDEPHFPLLAAMGVLGLVASLLRGRRLVPVWLVALALLDGRSFNALSAMPIGLLAGFAATEVIAPLARARGPLIAVAAAAGAYAVVSSAAANADVHRAITAEERAAMSWLAENTPADARIVVISQRYWASDRVGEWLPALTGRRTVTTVQGHEWFRGDQGFWPQVQRYDKAQECGARDGDCLERWARSFGGFEHVLLPKTVGGYDSDDTPAWCCGALRATLRADPRYDLVYDGAGATIFRRR